MRVAERMILGCLRNQIIFSPAELNEPIAIILDKLNNKKFQKLDVSRKELFENFDRPAMNPLPATRYEYGKWRKAEVNIDYHIEAERNYYFVPYSLIHKSVDVRLSGSTVEIWHQGRRIASHQRLFTKRRHQTELAHRPPSHSQCRHRHCHTIHQAPGTLIYASNRVSWLLH